MLAIRAGDDALARAALARKADHDEVAGQLKDQWEAQKTSVENLKGALRGLDNKIEEAKRKRNLLVSRQKRAEAQRTINETLSSINSTSAFDTFDRMSDRVTQLEAEAEATQELGGVLTEGSLESQFKALEASSVDDQLDALKRKMALTAGKTEDPRQLGSAKTVAAGDPPADDLKAAEIDAQLEELKKKLSSS